MGNPILCAGALLSCSKGIAPASISPEPKQVTTCGKMSANITDLAPESVIPSFSMCLSILNPSTAEETASAEGVLTPGSCTPNVVAWNGSIPTVTIAGKPILTTASTATCAYGGSISVIAPGQTAVTAS